VVLNVPHNGIIVYESNLELILVKAKKKWPACKAGHFSYP